MYEGRRMNGSTLYCDGVVPNKDGNVKLLVMFWGCITYFGVGNTYPS